jgi:hypothetical protein
MYHMFSNFLVHLVGFHRLGSQKTRNFVGRNKPRTEVVSDVFLDIFGSCSFPFEGKKKRE